MANTAHVKNDKRNAKSERKSDETKSDGNTTGETEQKTITSAVHRLATITNQSCADICTYTARFRGLLVRLSKSTK